jgi:hypothetical protein
MRNRRKNIIAIEAWENYELEPRAGMKSLLDFLTITNQTGYNYNFVYTPTELKYILETIPTKNYSLLYFALHGYPEQISLGSKTEFEIGLDQLAEWMGYRFQGFGLHFASCAIMNSWEDTLSSFKQKTGLAFISGFTRYVEFQSSAIVDHALIAEWAYSRSYRRMFDRLTNNHKTLLKNNGFEYLI